MFQGIAPKPEVDAIPNLQSCQEERVGLRITLYILIVHAIAPPSENAGFPPLDHSP